MKLDYGVTMELTSDEIENPIATSTMNPTTARPMITNGDMIDIHKLSR